ncbi:MAG: hypothetical protein DIJKHBIC_00035 [Thermoanaerobaculia bacterium]|nr:hypothetical protein [Thermoanaerobaculia bacterium]
MVTTTANLPGVPCQATGCEAQHDTVKVRATVGGLEVWIVLCGRHRERLAMQESRRASNEP